MEHTTGFPRSILAKTHGTLFSEKPAEPRLQPWEPQQPPAPRGSPRTGAGQKAPEPPHEPSPENTPALPARSAAGRPRYSGRGPSDAVTPARHRERRGRPRERLTGRPGCPGEGSGPGRQRRGLPDSPQAAKQSICSGSFSRIGTCSKASCMATAPPGPAVTASADRGEASAAGGSRLLRWRQREQPRPKRRRTPPGPRLPALPGSPRARPAAASARRLRPQAPVRLRLLRCSRSSRVPPAAPRSPQGQRVGPARPRGRHSPTAVACKATALATASEQPAPAPGH